MTTIDEKLELLIDQVGRFTEGMTEFRMAMERNHQEFNQKLDALGARLDQVAATTERQAETADRLVRVVELLVQQR